MIKTKSVYSPINRKQDGFRVLVTRFWPHGMKKTRCDAWMANLGPSEELLHAGQTHKISWARFVKDYRAELFETGPIDRRNRQIKNYGQKFTLRMLQSLAKRGPVTLMCYCPDSQPQCHRHVLSKVLRGKV